MAKLRRYWLTYPLRGVPVTFHLKSPYQVLWRGIYGISIGSWFIGAVKSSDHSVPPTIQQEGTPR